MSEQDECWARMTAFLSGELGVPKDALPTPGAWSCTGLTIGALALRLNVLTLDQIDVIIDHQATDGHRFGQIAVACGYLSETQVESLLVLQRLHWAIEATERLFIQGEIDLARLAGLLDRFVGSGGLEL